MSNLLIDILQNYTTDGAILFLIVLQLRIQRKQILRHRKLENLISKSLGSSRGNVQIDQENQTEDSTVTKISGYLELLSNHLDKRGK